MGWRERQAQRDRKAERREAGFTVLSWFIGTFVAGAAFAIGAWCLLTAAIPMATDYGLLWIGGRTKDGVATLVLGTAVAVHVGFLWSRIPLLRRAQAPALFLALTVAVAGLIVVV